MTNPFTAFSWILPSFLTPSSSSQRRSNSHTASLNGLRGLACLIVFNEHVTANLTANFLWGYGADGIHVWSQLPFLRVWFSGNSATCIFFVVSGYVLSYAAFEQALTYNDVEAAQRRIVSLILRRPIRLYVPMFATFLSCAVAAFLGLFDLDRKHYGLENPYVLHEVPPPRLESLQVQVYDAVKACVAAMKVGKFAANSPAIGGFYNDNTWTIPVEFQTSMLLLLIQVAMLRLSPAYTQGILTGLMASAYFSDRWEIVCFLIGALIAVSDVDSKCHHHFHQWSWRNVFAVTLGLFLLSAPSRDCLQDPFYAPLISMLPSKAYDGGCHLRALGAGLITWSTLHVSNMQSAFTHPILLYFGRISFSFFLVHGPIIRCIFHSIIPALYLRTGDGTYDGQETWGTMVAWAVGVLLCFPVAVWIADIFARVVDLPTLQLSKWVERHLLARA